MKIYLAPLEGITGYIYRNAYEKHYGNIDKYFAPFITPSEKYTIVPKGFKDLLPENNAGVNLVPQILTNDSKLFINAANEIANLGYKEINLNLGCPSGTVCAKGKGAGFLPETEELKTFLSDIYDYGGKENIDISIKTRLGYFNPDEFYDLIEIFNEYPVYELTVHPRIRSDFYKGDVRLEYYKHALETSRNPLVYNGNVFSATDYRRISAKLDSSPETVMLGRGIIANPNLTNELLTGKSEIDFNRFWAFHDEIYESYKEVLSPDINILHKMKELWSEWEKLFEDSSKAMKQIRKAKKLFEYEEAIGRLK